MEKFESKTASLALEASHKEVLGYAQEAEGLTPAWGGARNFMEQFQETYPEFPDHILLTGFVAGLFSKPPYPGPKREEAKKNIALALTHFQTVLENAKLEEPNSQPQANKESEEATGQFLGNISQEEAVTDEKSAPTSPVSTINSEETSLKKSLGDLEEVLASPEGETSGPPSQEAFENTLNGTSEQLGNLPLDPPKPKASVGVAPKGIQPPEGHKRLTINLSEDRHKKLMVEARLRGTTATKLIEDMIDRL